MSAEIHVVVNADTPSGHSSQSQTGKYYRDGHGKSRQDTSYGSVITDSVAKTVVYLDHTKKTASVVHVPMSSTPPQADNSRHVADSSSNVSSEEDGFMNGYKIKKTKVQLSLASRNAGSSNALPTTQEVWTAPELNLPIYMRTKGPQSETVQSFEKIVVAPPNADLFSIPADYKVSEKGVAQPGQKYEAAK